MHYGPTKRRDLIKGMKACGFDGPVRLTERSDHEYMVKGDLRVKINNQHHQDISIDLLASILKQAGISRKEWEQA